MISRKFNVASVSFLNAKPLIYGLERRPDVNLLLAVPAKLLDLLRSGAADVALLPSIDYQREPGLRMIPSAGIGSDGETLTVRLFSRIPFERVTTLACDQDSHTSIALARIILAERYGIRPEMRELVMSDLQTNETILLIGDKVISAEPSGYPYQLDLGAAWKELTGLPFVFAVWMARQGVELGDLPATLANARIEGLKAVESIIAEHAPPRHWPIDVARDYLTKHLEFGIGDAQLKALALFYSLAAKHRIIDRARDIVTACKETRTK